MARVNVAGVFAHLGFEVDTSGAKRFEAEIDKARAAALRPIEQKVDVEFEKARVSLAKLESEAARTRQKLERERIVLGVEADVDKLKKGLSESEKVITDYTKRINATDNARSKGQLARYRDEALAAGEAARKELAARKEVLAAVRGANKELVQDEKERAAVERTLAAQTRALLADRGRAQKAFSASVSAAERDRAAETIAAEKAIDAAWKDHLGTLKQVEAQHKNLAAVEAQRARETTAAEREIERQWNQHIRTLGIFGRDQERAARAEVANQQQIIRARDRAERQLGAGDRGMRRLMRTAAELSDRNELSVRNLAQSFRTLDRTSGRSLNLLQAAGNRMDKAFAGLGIRLGPISGSLQKLGGIAALLTPLFVSLVSVMVEFAGSLGAAALGVGALATGIVGLLGPLAVLGGAIAVRVGKMSDAWTAMGNAEQKAGRDAEASGKKQATATDAVANAQEGLADAIQQRARTQRDAAETVEQSHEAMVEAADEEREAQNDLTDARFRARREIEDLNSALEDSILVSERAQLSLDEALVDLQRVQLDPHATSVEIREAQLAVDEARASAKDAQTQRQRAQEDVRRGTDTVTEAEKRVADAHQRTADAREAASRAERTAAEQNADAAQGVARAARAVTAAQRQSQQAIDGVSATAQTAKEKLAELSTGERQTLFAFKRISDEFQRAMRPATDAIFLGIAGGLRRLVPLFGRFRDEFKTLGEEIGDIFRNAGRSLAGPEWTRAFQVLLESATRIVEPLAHAIGEVFEIVRNIAVAAQPFVLDFVRGVDRVLTRIADRTSDLSATRDIIGDLLEHTRSWLALLEQVGRLLFNIFRGGARGGQEMVDGLTRIIDGWNDFLETSEGQERMLKVFRDARSLLDDIWQFLRGLFDGITQVVVPLGRVATLIAKLAGAIVGLAPGGREGNPFRNMAYWLGIIAALKLTNITRLFSLMRLALGNAGQLRTLAAALMGGGSGRQALGHLLTEPGATPGKPLYTFEVNPAAATGPGGIPGVPGGRGGRGGVRGLVGAAGRLGAAAAAVDLTVNLVDSKGNPIAAAVNTAHDLTFGLVPSVKVDERRGERARQQSSAAAGGSTKDVFVDEQGFPISRQEAQRTAGAQVIRRGTTKAVPFSAEEVKRLNDQYRKAGEAAGKAFVEGLDSQHTFFTRSGLFRRFSEQLDAMRPEMRSAAERQMIEYAKGLEHAGRVPRGTTAKLVKDIKAQFGTLPDGIRDPTKRGIDSLANQFRRNDIVRAAQDQADQLKHVYDDFPRDMKFTGQNAARNFLTELEFLRDKAATSTGRLKSQAEKDLKAVESAAKKYGHGANVGLNAELEDMGIKGTKRAGHVRAVIVRAFERMADGVGGFTDNAADALYESLQNMGQNAEGVLHALGLPLPKWRIKAKQEYNRQKVSHLPAQTGKYVPGVGDGDKIPAMLEAGEYVLNKKLVRKIGREHLDTLNFEAVPRFARGGAPQWGAHPPLGGAIARLVGIVQSRFPLQVTSTSDHSRLTTSGNVSNHVLGLAADLSASQDVMRRAANWIKRNVGRSLLEGIHNPNLSIKGGKTVPAGFWGGAWAQHIDHIHVAVRSLAGAAGVAAGLADRVRRQIVDGPRGAMRDIVQGLSDNVRKGLNKYIGKQDAGADIEALSAGALSKNQLKSLWVRARGPRNVANIAAAIALAESGGIPNRNNADRPGDGGRHIAAGLWQILGLPFRGNAYDPLTNARMAVAKFRGARNTFRPWVAFTNGSYRQYLQRGGWLGGRGAMGADTIPVAPGVAAAPGEYVAYGQDGGAVFNRHQVPLVERALGGPIDGRSLPVIERAMGGAASLRNFFSRVARPHSAPTRHMASGGSFSKHGAIGGGAGRPRAKDPYKIGKTVNRAKIKIQSYESIMGDGGMIDRLQKDYEYWDRVYGSSEEILIDPETGLVNTDQVNKRVSELSHLETIRVSITNALREAARLAKQIHDTYRNLTARLLRSISYAPNKKRKGIEAQVDLYDGEARAWASSLADVRDQIRFSELDIQDVRDERAEVAATQPDQDIIDRNKVDLATDADAEARAAQAEARAAAVAADLQAAQQNLGALLSPGDIGTAVGGTNALSVVRNDIARALGTTQTASAAGGTTARTGAVHSAVVGSGAFGTSAGYENSGIVINVHTQSLIPGSADTMHQVGRAVASALDFNANPAPGTRMVG